MNISSGGKAPAVSATHIVALYDPSSGRIAHLHEVVVFAGGKEVGRDQAEQEAKEVARKHGHMVDKLHVLHADRLPELGVCRVDVERKVLVAVAAPARERKPRR